MRLASIAAAFGTAAGISAFAAGGLSVAACSSSSVPAPASAEAGQEAAAPEDARPEAAALPYPLNQVCGPSAMVEPCAKCARERCCDTHERIRGNDAGNALADCLAPNTPDGGPAPCDLACQTACFDKSPGETPAYLDHLTCLYHLCPAECDDADGPVSPCLVCMGAKCLADSVACGLSRDCFLFGSCVGGCGQAAGCVDACATRYPAGAALQNALLVCTSNRCASDCQ